MKITLISDAHTEFGPLTLPGGSDVLILAGDIAEYRTFSREYQLAQDPLRKPGPSKTYDFFYKECAKYPQVFMVSGNHEHYHHRLDKTYEDLKAILPANVTLLENECVEYNGVMFMGATLWTDLNGHDPVTAYTLKSGMNDYRVIQNYYPDRDVYHKLTPEFTAGLHSQTVKYFRTALAANPSKPFVMITHHAPTRASISSQFKDDYLMNGGFASDLSEFILDHDQLKFCLHGHVHTPCDYMVGTTRVIANPRGYYGHEDTSQFDPSFSFEV